MTQDDAASRRVRSSGLTIVVLVGVFLLVCNVIFTNWPAIAATVGAPGPVIVGGGNTVTCYSYDAPTHTILRSQTINPPGGESCPSVAPPGGQVVVTGVYRDATNDKLFNADTNQQNAVNSRFVVGNPAPGVSAGSNGLTSLAVPQTIAFNTITSIESAFNAMTTVTTTVPTTTVVTTIPTTTTVATTTVATTTVATTTVKTTVTTTTTAVTTTTAPLQYFTEYAWFNGSWHNERRQEVSPVFMDYNPFASWWNLGCGYPASMCGPNPGMRGCGIGNTPGQEGCCAASSTNGCLGCGVWYPAWTDTCTGPNLSLMP